MKLFIINLLASFLKKLILSVANVDFVAATFFSIAESVSAHTKTPVDDRWVKNIKSAWNRAAAKQGVEKV